MEVLRHAVATFTFVLQEAYPLNASVIDFPENLCNMEVFKHSSITRGQVRLMPNIPHSALTDKQC
jgi:hypothetical protein